MIRIYLLLSLILISLVSLGQEEPKFKPHGSPIIRVFANYHSDFENVAAFQITRGYLGYKYSINEKYSMKVIYDVGNPKDGGKLEHTGYVKIAQLQYKYKNLQWRVGIIPTKQFKYQEHWWGYRYILKSYQDEYKMNASADIGASAEYKIFDKLRVEAIVQNGEGYKKIQGDATFRGGVGLTFEPMENLRLRIYYDNSTKPDAQLQSIATYIGYDFKKKVSIGAEYNMQLDYKMTKGHDLGGASAYLTYFLNDKFQFFGRLDYLSSNTYSGDSNPWNYNKDGNYFIVGGQAKLAKGVKVSLNYRGFQSANTNIDYSNMIFLSLEYRLK